MLIVPDTTGGHDVDWPLKVAHYEAGVGHCVQCSGRDRGRNTQRIISR